MVNRIQAIQWLANNEHIKLNSNNSFVKTTYKDRVYNFFHWGHEREQSKRITDLIQANLQHPSENRQSWLNLASLFIQKNKNNHNIASILKVFDRSISQYRASSDNFDHPENQKFLEKWTRNGMPAELFVKHPDFCDFLEESTLLSQIKITRDSVLEVDGEPGLIVEGKPMKWSTFKEQFEVIFSKRYKQKLIFKKSTYDVYTYLDNRRGLEKHHPYNDVLAPISHVNQEEYDKIATVAKTFVRSNEETLPSENRCFILQITSSLDEGWDTHFNNLLTKPKHPFLNLVAGADFEVQGIKVRKGDVLDVGYELKNRTAIPLVATQGQFRSPDVYNYKSYKKRIVTNIPVTLKEAQALCEYTLKYHRRSTNLGNETGFHFMKQNCTTYVKAATEAAGITVPVDISLVDLINEIAPDWIKAIGRGLIAAKNTCHQAFKKVGKILLLPSCVKKGINWIANKVDAAVKRVLSSMAALTLAPVNAALGGQAGEGGEAFVPPESPPKAITPPLKSWRTWLDVSAYRFNLPGILQRWQLEQPSTVVYHNPIKLCIVPPPKEQTV